jgi:hypothetical protein
MDVKKQQIDQEWCYDIQSALAKLAAPAAVIWDKENV